MSALTLNQAPKLPLLRSLFFITGAVIIIFLTLRAIPQDHAVQQHGPEAIAVRNCINHEGPAWHKLNNRDLVQYWQSKEDPDTFFQTCQLPDGRWGFQAVRKNNGKWWEKTAFIKGSGTLKELLRYLADHGTPFKGQLP